MPLNPHTPAPSPSERVASGDAPDAEPAAAATGRGGHPPAPTAASTAPAPASAAPAGAAAAGIPAETPAARAIKIPKIRTGLPLRKRSHEARRIAIEVFPQTDSWVVFYREILGVDGVVRQLFPSVEELRHWESSEEFLEVQEMLTALRSSDSGKGETVEPQRMITVRLPMSVHETLKVEAEEHQTSMNKLCLSKLMMNIADRFIPIESGRIRGRKPGPQGKRKPAAEPVEQSAAEPPAGTEQSYASSSSSSSSS